MEFKGTKGEIHAVEYAGVIFMQDSEFYEDSEKCNILDYDHVGRIEADANGKLFECAPKMLERLKELIRVFENEATDSMQSEAIYYGKELIKKATTI